MTKPPLLMSRLDCRRIEAVLEHVPAGTDVRALEAELGRAEVIEPADMPPDVVTMNSTTRFLDESRGEEHEMTLVFPHEMDGSPSKVSILAPVGTALLGLRVGHTIELPLPGGHHTSLRVLSIRYQPEAAGELPR